MPLTKCVPATFRCAGVWPKRHWSLAIILCLGFMAGVGCAGVSPRARAPDLSLVDPQQRRMSLADLGGQVVVLTFVYTHCDLTCPLNLAMIANAIDLDAGGVAVAVVTVDPERDTPDQLAEYAARWPAQWHFLTGTPSGVARVWRAFGVSVEKNEASAHPSPDVQGRYDVIHSAKVLVLDRDGFVASELRGGWTATDLQNAVAHVAAGQAAGDPRGGTPLWRGLLARCGAFAAAHPWTFGGLVLIAMLPGFAIPAYVFRVLVRPGMVSRDAGRRGPGGL